MKFKSHSHAVCNTRLWSPFIVVGKNSAWKEGYFRYKVQVCRLYGQAILIRSFNNCGFLSPASKRTHLRVSIYKLSGERKMETEILGRCRKKGTYTLLLRMKISQVSMESSTESPQWLGYVGLWGQGCDKFKWDAVTFVSQVGLKWT